MCRVSQRARQCAAVDQRAGPLKRWLIDVVVHRDALHAVRLGATLHRGDLLKRRARGLLDEHVLAMLEGLGEPTRTCVSDKKKRRKRDGKIA